MDENQLQQAVDDLGSAFEEFKKTHTEELKQRALTGDVDALVKEKMDKLQATIETRQAEIDTERKKTTEAHDEKIEELQTALTRASSAAPDPKVELELRSQACDLIRADYFDQGQPLDLTPETVDDKDLEGYKVYRDLIQAGEKVTLYVKDFKKKVVRTRRGKKIPKTISAPIDLPLSELKIECSEGLVIEPLADNLPADEQTG